MNHEAFPEASYLTKLTIGYGELVEKNCVDWSSTCRHTVQGQATQTPKLQMGSLCTLLHSVYYITAWTTHCCSSATVSHGCQDSAYSDVLFVFVCCCRLLSVLCCNLDSFLLLESQYNICSMLLQCQRENVTELDTDEGYETNKHIVKNVWLEIYTFYYCQ